MAEPTAKALAVLIVVVLIWRLLTFAVKLASATEKPTLFANTIVPGTVVAGKTAAKPRFRLKAPSIVPPKVKVSAAPVTPIVLSEPSVMLPVQAGLFKVVILLTTLEVVIPTKAPFVPV